MKELLKTFKKFAFLDELIQLGYNTYLVGGCVRDSEMKIIPKDIDVVIEGIEYSDLAKILTKYGKCDLVGSAFGVLVYKDAQIECEIAVPRIEIKIGEGHTGFEVKTSAELTILDDLGRRDYTMNAIAIKHDGTIVDPFDGIGDIKRKLIKMVNAKAFQEDPLRMLRGVNFFSRFDGFTFEEKTLEEIYFNACKIVEITGERIHIELEKIVSKGNIERGLIGLKCTDLFKYIFGTDTITYSSPFDKVKTMGEFIFIMLKDSGTDIEAFYKTILKGDLDTAKEIKALTFIHDKYTDETDFGDARYIASQAIKISSRVKESLLLPQFVRLAMEEFKLGLYPSGLKDLSVKGDDLIELGLSGKQIGETLDVILRLTYKNKFK